MTATGMVHPDYRRQGVFGKLYQLVQAEWERRSSTSMLLLSDRNSVSGQAFVRGTGARYEHSEYEMTLNQERFLQLPSRLNEVTFQKATNEDAREIARQNAIYFGVEDPEEIDGLLLPEEEAARGMSIYLAEKDERVIGKVHLQSLSGVGGIYGLGVLPEERGKGLGRAILLQAVGKLQETNASVIMLQVAADNDKALDLYKSCGFETSSTMDYYELRKHGNADSNENK
ncbi:GNAT family N-acetyltransferase [Cohnella sp. LGH]|uniref:GNAT family N-acetyltransferase n=1 Tax=Cohnella sp. LGH TaxID=1619153 RepID=UPI001ADB8ABC|nr:GNAT family N-acetyltransferase [Cohnella sp. LGH]QTH44559.1 GNAT family N-acetyltransferase [Cohnella sp. LGH]